MKRDLRVKLKNKRRQYWWDKPRYAAAVKGFINDYAMKQTMFVTFFRSLQGGEATYVLFAFPVATALALMGTLTLVYLLLYLLKVALSSIGLFLWMIFIDLLHLPLIAVYRCVEILRRRVLKRNIYVCPNCHTDIWVTRYKVPGFRCEHQEEHYFVRPSTYGLLAHEGQCGCSIPTLQWSRNGFSAEEETNMFCPICHHKRKIGIEGFGQLPHLSLAVLSAQAGGKNETLGTEFLKSAWAGFTLPEASLQVGYADLSNAPEFEEIVQTSLSIPAEYRHAKKRRKNGPWVWRVTSARSKTLLYLHQLGAQQLGHGETGEEGGMTGEVFKTISGLTFVVSSRLESQDADALFGPVKRALETRFGLFGTKLPLPVAVIVQDCANGKEGRAAMEEKAGNFVRSADSAFMPVHYFGGGEKQSAAALKWLLARCKELRVL